VFACETMYLRALVYAREFYHILMLSRRSTVLTCETMYLRALVHPRAIYH